jgi:hypothetical protein
MRTARSSGPRVASFPPVWPPDTTRHYKRFRSVAAGPRVQASLIDGPWPGTRVSITNLMTTDPTRGVAVEFDELVKFEIKHDIIDQDILECMETGATFTVVRTNDPTGSFEAYLKRTSLPVSAGLFGG